MIESNQTEQLPEDLKASDTPEIAEKINTAYVASEKNEATHEDDPAKAEISGNASETKNATEKTQDTKKLVKKAEPDYQEAYEQLLKEDQKETQAVIKDTMAHALIDAFFRLGDRRVEDALTKLRAFNPESPETLDLFADVIAAMTAFKNESKVVTPKQNQDIYGQCLYTKNGGL